MNLHEKASEATNRVMEVLREGKGMFALRDAIQQELEIILNDLKFTEVQDERTTFFLATYRRIRSETNQELPGIAMELTRMKYGD